MADLSERVRTSLAGRYTIERELGRGGMATVYLARDLKHDRPVALKVLRPELALTLGADRFLREIQVTAHLTHPNILPLLDSGRADEFLYYVTPYVEGESLRSRLNREKRLPVDEALRLATEVAGALDYAHRHQIVHRDIKPENILLEDGQAVVADFGIARAIHAAEGERLTETGLAVGTAAYMSPEQAAGERDVDGRSDMYSLGCVLYEMLAGEPPFTGPTAQAVLAKRFAEPVPHVRTLRDTVPDAVERALQRALARAPVDRFATAAQLASALVGVSAPSAAAKRSWHVPAVAAGAVVVLAALAWMIKQRVVSPTILGDAAAVLPFRVAGPDSSVWREGLVDLLSINLDGVSGLRVIPPRTVLSRWHLDVGKGTDVADHSAGGTWTWGRGPMSPIKTPPFAWRVPSALALP